MGSSFYAYTVIGVRVKADQLYKERQKEGCSCWSKGYGVFCSSCGKPRIIGDDIPVEGYQPDKETLKGFGVITLTYCDYAYIAYQSACVSTDGTDDQMIDPSYDIKHIMKIMKRDLEPLGLWDKFGLWCIGHVS